MTKYYNVAEEVSPGEKAYIGKDGLIRRCKVGRPRTKGKVIKTGHIVPEDWEEVRKVWDQVYGKEGWYRDGVNHDIWKD